MNNIKYMPADMLNAGLRRPTPPGEVQTHFGGPGSIPVRYTEGGLFLTKAMLTRTVTMSTTATLLAGPNRTRAYLILNPSRELGTALSTTLLDTTWSLGAISGATTGLNTEAYQQCHVFTNLTFSIGLIADFDIWLQTYDSVSGNWVTVSLIIAVSTGTAPATTTYTYLGPNVLAEQIRFLYSGVTGGDTIAVTIHCLLKNGYGTGSSGIYNSIFLGNRGVTTTLGYPLLPGEEKYIILAENASLYGIVESGADVTARILEL